MKNVRRIIFLDIDGVLNSEVDYMLNELEEAHDISKRCIGLLNILIKDTGAEVVITSVWRYSRTISDLQKLFNDFGFIGKIIGKTDVLGKYSIRGNEILKWIRDNENYIGCHSSDYDKYVILDDDTDMLYWQKDNFIKVDGYVGLTPTIIYKATWILK